MATQEKKWLIKKEDGFVNGPFSTPQVLEQIRSGDFSGSEFVSLFPGGQWIAISKEPEFYDQLLEAMFHQDKSSATKKPVTASQEFGSSKKSNADLGYSRAVKEPTPPPVPETKPRGVAEKLNVKKEVPSEPDHQEVIVESAQDFQQVHSMSEEEQDEETDSEIELIRRDEGLRQSKMKKAVAPILFACAVGAAAYFFLLPSVPRGAKVKLVEPKFSSLKLSPAQIKAKTEKGLRAFFLDTTGDYDIAQKEFASALEGGEQNPQILSFLCLSYHELWPFTAQDSSDIRAVAKVTQRVSQLDPGGIHSATCRTVDNVIRSRYREVTSITENILASDLASQAVSAYYFKASGLEAKGEIALGVNYLTSASQLWPNWLRLKTYEGQLLSRLGKHVEAANAFRDVIKRNPKHALAMMELGLIELSSFHRAEQAMSWIQKALGQDTRISPQTLFRGLLAMALIHQRQGDRKKALQFANSAMELNPLDSQVRDLVTSLGGQLAKSKDQLKDQQALAEGEQFLREGDCQKAQSKFKAAYEINPKNPVAAKKAAQCLWELSLASEAILWLDNAIKADYKYIDAYVLLADYYSQRFNFIAADKVIQKANQISPRHFDIVRGAAMIEFRKKNYDMAATYANQALKMNASDSEANAILAEAQLAQGLAREAFASAAKAIEIDGNSPASQDIYSRTLAEFRGPELALTYLTDLAKNYPYVSEYRIFLAKMYLKYQRYENAQVLFEQYIRSEPKPKQGYLGLGRVYKFRSQLRDAQDQFLRAALLDPSDPEPLFELGLMFLENKKPGEALAQFNNVLTLNKLYPLVYFYSGRAALDMGDVKNALEMANQEKQANPKFVEPYLLAAEAYFQSEQYGKCAEEYQKIIRIRAPSSQVYVKVARCYRLSGNLDLALSMLNQAALRESGDPEIYKEQGAVYETKGDLERAVAAYQQYFVLDPNAPDRSGIEDRVRALQNRSRR